MSGGGKSRSKGLVEAYRAAILLRLLTGLGRRRVCRVLKDLGFEVSLGTINHWFHHNKKPYFTPSSFEKALFYHKAYELAIRAKAEHPEWGHKRIATYISRQLPIRVPPITVYYWITGRSKPNVTRVRPCPALGYLVGVLVGDYRRSRKSKGLRVKDKEFAEYYAKKYGEVTGVKLDVHTDGEGYWHTYENAGWLRELWYSGLWKVVAYAYPLEFLKGLYDSEGSISPVVNWRRGKLLSVAMSLSIGVKGVVECIEDLLNRYGFKTSRTYRPPQMKKVRNKIHVFGECWVIEFYGWDKLERFARLIGFREGKRRRRLELLLKIRSLSPRKRFEEWTRYYVKVRGRWVERAPNPRTSKIEL